MLKNERGLSLIEVLSTLTILSIIGVIIWQVFFQGFNFSKTAISKNLMVQETNILLTNFKSIHQTIDNYSFRSIDSNCGIAVDYGTTTKEFTSTKLCFSLEPIELYSKQIEPNQENAPLKLIVSDKNKPENLIETEAILYRMKGGSN